MESFNLSKESAENAENSERINQKLEEIIELISSSKLDNKSLSDIQSRFNAAILSKSESTALQPFNGKRMHSSSQDNDHIDQLLFINTDKSARKKHTFSQYLKLGLRLIIAILLILLGFGMIIMPAPPYFEMFTLFYLNPNDGVTIMDIISLIVAFTGVYILITALTKLRR